MIRNEDSKSVGLCERGGFCQDDFTRAQAMEFRIARHVQAREVVAYLLENGIYCKLSDVAKHFGFNPAHFSRRMNPARSLLRIDTTAKTIEPHPDLVRFHLAKKGIKK